jgi:Zn-dependent M28 family amino/carboxypeptidase
MASEGRIGSHYDTKWLPKIRFVGANDAASSTGCLLEIARVLSQIQLGRDVAVVFFDGEEAFERYSEKDGLYGSRHLASTLKDGGSLRHLKGVIVLDMIGDKDLKITIAAGGDPGLSRAIFEAAEALGWRDHFALMSTALTDDHEPFQKEGVPSIDLIDFNYGPDNAFWHTPQDTLENISPRSLEIAGKTVLKMLEQTDGR